MSPRFDPDCLGIGAACRDGVSGGAILILDTAGAAVLAQVGSPDFLEAAHAGQFDATAARRSPGSTLKPFLYALAIERNRLYPCETLLDDTLDLGLYNPKNFDESFRGLISADNALRASLNVPAVMVLDRVGDEEALVFLRRCGLTAFDSPGARYGLGLALGNCEARLDQLVPAYAMLANLGEFRPLYWLPVHAPPATPLLSPGTALSILNALRQPLPGEADAQAVGTVGAHAPVAWKTGTSTGNRDAWAFVFNRQYVVGVWLGNPDGRRSARLVGAEAALPLAAGLFRGLPTNDLPPWPAAEDALRPVEVCALSGLPATQWCPHARVASLPRTQWLDRRCDVHWPVPARGEVTSGDDPVFERWPGSARQWDLAAVQAPFARRVSVAPSHSAALQILEPAAGAGYVFTGEPTGDRVRLHSSLDRSLAVHWFRNDSYLGLSDAVHPLYLDLTPGRHKLVCVSEDHQIASVFYTVAPTPDRTHFNAASGPRRSDMR